MNVSRSCLWLLPLVSCASPSMDDSTLADDAALLAEHADVLRLASGDGWVLVSPQLQGRVMTSGFADGEAGLGFVNRGMIAAPPESAAFFNYGGEDRFWFGPEGGPYALYFGDSAERDLDHWQVPAALHEGAFAVEAKGAARVAMSRRMQLRNAVGTTFDAEVERTVEVPSRAEVDLWVGGLPEDAEWVGFRTRNRVTNSGAKAWIPEAGLPCIWILGMFAPGDEAFVIAPFLPDGPGAPVRDSYFGAVPEDRLRTGSNFALFRADAQRRSKIGVLRGRAVDVAGSYDPGSGVLTLVRFGPVDHTARYVDETWPVDQPGPWSGDVMNSYNHGGPEPFYEIESSSPALELRPGSSHEHAHTTVHLRFADEADLARAVENALGVRWDEVKELAGWSGS